MKTFTALRRIAYLRRRLSTTQKHGRSSVAATTAAATAGDALQEGSVIEHQRFGVGRVVKLEGVCENQKATVEFKNTGTKQLLLKFARYKVIG